MEENKATEPGTALAVDQVEQVAGGDGCTTTVTFSAPGGTIQSTYNSLGEAISGTYDGLVDGTSHIIETVANSMK